MFLYLHFLFLSYTLFPVPLACSTETISFIPSTILLVCARCVKEVEGRLSHAYDVASVIVALAITDLLPSLMDLAEGSDGGSRFRDTA